MLKPMTIVLLLAPLCALVAPDLATAQDQERTFSLTRSERAAAQEEEARERHEPQIRAGKLETSLTLGFQDLGMTLLAHDQIIYKRTDERTFWGDVDLVGEPAFNPILRLSYNLTSWFALEGQFNFSVTEYTAQITNPWSRENTDDPNPAIPVTEIGEFDAERRSVLTYGGGMSALIYPFNITGSRISRWHPYLIGTYDRIWFDLNSNYTAGTSAQWVYGLGGGLRFIADRLVSIRLEASYRTTELQLTPAENFEVLNEGTLPIPLYQYDMGRPFPVESFESNDISGLSWSVGFIASF
jgi:hypothetical protein